MDIADRDYLLSSIKLLSSRDIPPTRAALLKTESLTRWYKDDAALDSILDELVVNGSVARVGEAYRLTDEGRRLAHRAEARDFGAWMVKCERSAAFRKFSARLSGIDGCRFDMLTQNQLEQLLKVLSLTKGQRILDLGCGTGWVTEYIADHTGGFVTGIDFSAEAIEFAQAKTAGNNDRLSFQVMDMDDLRLPSRSFDAVLSIDSLYFAADLAKTVASIKDCLKPNGQLGIFYSARISGDQPADLLAPAGTRLAQALAGNGLAFETWDFTAEEKAFWEKHLQIANGLEGDFEAEGNLAIFDDRVFEATMELELCRAGRKSRYLYHVFP